MIVLLGSTVSSEGPATLTLGEGRFSEIQRGFEQAPANESLLAVAIVALLTLVLFPVLLAAAVRLRRYLRQPERIAWRGMSKALGLSWPDRRLLALLARQRGLQPAAALLISRGAFESAVTAYLAHGSIPQHSKQQIQRLRKMIFSTSSTYH